MDTVLKETYYRWLEYEAFSDPNDRTRYEGVLKELHDIPFYWTIVSDDNRAGDALNFRQHEFLDFYEGKDDMDQMILAQWATAAPSVLEVLLGISRRWAYYFEQPVSFFFAHLFQNMGFHWCPGHPLDLSTREAIRLRCDIWMARRFKPNGEGSPFPIKEGFGPDLRGIDIWGQMNAYSAQHFQ